MSMAVSIGADTVSIYNDGDFYSVDKSHSNYAALLEALRKVPRDDEEVMALVDIPRYITHVTAGRVSVSSDSVLFENAPVNGYMVDRLITMAANGDPIESWARFMDNLMDNPAPGVREDLYRWMEVGKLPITDDGCIVAFKKVRGDYKDVHSGKFDNSPGAVLEMDRALCDPSRNNTCSTGFHFCSAGYLNSFGGQKVMVVKINPRDVTAIPTDYNNQKARCCKYTVTAELTGESAAKHKVWSEKNVINLEDPRELPEVMIPRTAEEQKKVTKTASTFTAPRKGVSPKDVKPDPKRATGPAPKDDLAPGATVSSVEEVLAKIRKGGGKSRTTGKSSALAAPYGTQTAPSVAEPTFKSKGAEFTVADVRSTLETAGSQSAAAKALGVPESTFKGWVKTVRSMPETIAPAPEAAVDPTPPKKAKKAKASKKASVLTEPLPEQSAHQAVADEVFGTPVKAKAPRKKVSKAGKLMAKISSAVESVLPDLGAVTEPAPQTAVGQTFKSKAGTFTAQQVSEAMEAAGGKYSVAGKALGVPESTLKGWVKKI